jgi:hypothetical protein
MNGSLGAEDRSTERVIFGAGPFFGATVRHPRWSEGASVVQAETGCVMLRYEGEGGDPRELGVFGCGRSPLLSAAGTIEHAGLTGYDDPVDPELGGAAGALRSWVVGWTHRFDPLGARRAAEPGPAGVRRLVEAVVDVLLERRSAEQVKRWVSREVFGLLSTVAQRRAATRFAARSMVRSIRLHAPGPDAVESTVLVQDGPRVRAVALRFERAVPSSSVEWRCTALQFA